MNLHSSDDFSCNITACNYSPLILPNGAPLPDHYAHNKPWKSLYLRRNSGRPTTPHLPSTRNMSSINYSATLTMAYNGQIPVATSSTLDSTTTVNIQPQQFLRSRSLSPRQSTHRTSRGWAVIGPMCSKATLRSAHSTNSTSETPVRYISPFISTKSRPSLYQRAISGYPETTASTRGRSRSRSSAGTVAVLPAPSYAGAMIPPFTGYQRPNGEESRGGSDTSFRCSSGASTTDSTTISNSSVKRSFVAKLKSVLKGGEEMETNTTYLTPEKAKQREIRIKKAFHESPIPGGLRVPV
ncbi:hypothetical protein EV426DRAFT_630040 [Tirmania nivea]|nr:hypothetical protein EV426DRAFT_630040 [Tirmania nivea]